MGALDEGKVDGTKEDLLNNAFPSIDEPSPLHL